MAAHNHQRDFASGAGSAAGSGLDARTSTIGRAAVGGGGAGAGTMLAAGAGAVTVAGAAPSAIAGVSPAASAAGGGLAGSAFLPSRSAISLSSSAINGL